MARFRQMPIRRIMFVPLLIWGLTAGIAPAAAADRDVLQAVVGLTATIPAEARTAAFLGTERTGSGVLIDNEGLILTIGYLILEADGAIVTGADGTQVPARVVAYDHDTGFGLVRTTRPLDIKPMRIGDSSKLSEREQVLVASLGGPQPIIAAQVVDRRVFAGAWEYLLEDAIFTSPPHRFHSGAALVGEDGRLLGIGSLFVNNAAAPTIPIPGNMFVPVDGLKPILADLLSQGRRSTPARPWIGANTNEVHGRIMVFRTSRGGPAESAGLQAGDLILGVEGKPLSGQADFYRKLWGAGKAGDTIKLNILPKDGSSLDIVEMPIKSIDRSSWLRLNRTF